MADKHTLARTVAPDVDPAWTDAFMVTLRFRGVAGTAIADALAEVNDYVRTSGEQAETSFGPPRQYAESLDLPVVAPMGAHLAGQAAVPAIVAVLGLSLVCSAVRPLRDGLQVEVQLGQISPSP